MKLLLLVMVIVFAGWLIATRRRGPAAPRRKSQPAPGGQQATAMIACAHCGVHVPQADTLVDAQGRRYCSEAHRLAAK